MTKHVPRFNRDNKATTGHIILLRRYGPVRATGIMTEGIHNKAVTVQMT